MARPSRHRVRSPTSTNSGCASRAATRSATSPSTRSCPWTYRALRDDRAADGGAHSHARGCGQRASDLRREEPKQSNATCRTHLLMKKRTKHRHSGHAPLGCRGHRAGARSLPPRLKRQPLLFSRRRHSPRQPNGPCLSEVTGFVRFFTNEGAGHFVLERSERVRLVLAITPMKNGKARTLRTKHGPLGCHGDIVLRPRHCAERRLS